MIPPRDKQEADALGKQWTEEALAKISQKIRTQRRTKRSSVKGYVVGGFAFVPHPAARGLWLRVHMSVAYVPCSHCGAEIASPCVGRSGPLSQVHNVRRRDARPILAKKDEISISIVAR